MPQSFPRRYVQPSPPLVDDMYADLVPQIVQQLVSYLEITGPTTEDLFGGDPSIRQINDLIDDLNAAGEHADVDQLSRGNPRLAAATLRRAREATADVPACFPLTTVAQGP